MHQRESLPAAADRQPLPIRQARPDGLTVSAMGLGCMGMSEFYGASDDEQSRDLLRYAIDRGERFFDTADIYGYGHNEMLVGRVLRDHPLRSEIVLATKGGILRDRADVTRRGVDTSPRYVRAAIQRSLDRLQTPIDLYYLHRVEDDGARIEESMAALADEIAAGRIGAVGLSEVSADTIERADAALRRSTKGRHGLAAVQHEFSLMTRNIEINGVLDTCRRLGILLVAYSPVCRGLLADRSLDPSTMAADDFRRFALPRFTPEHFAHNRRLAQVLYQVAGDEGITPAQAALAWVLSRAPNVVPIPGTRSRSRLDENLAATTMVLSESAVARLAEVFRPDAAVGLRYAADAMKAYGLRD
ncbi:MAG: aldo/keto reductase [Lautropia sp.]|nr:aldo/keto reductase [Lautropia sp.]